MDSDDDCDLEQLLIDSAESARAATCIGHGHHVINSEACQLHSNLGHFFGIWQSDSHQRSMRPILRQQQAPQVLQVMPQVQVTQSQVLRNVLLSDFSASHKCTTPKTEMAQLRRSVYSNRGADL